ncbi:MAG: 30S ribosomal protein S6 [Bifidobacteriaceae bacterium]|jgi:small subunit ribosomal protein S6|nr:30S ribosomal protein S6 [Bifidobacteriaceae bacterium]
MIKYEMMTILDSSLNSEKVSDFIDKVSTVIKSDKGTVDHVDNWGKRTLAYEIKKHNDGNYVLFEYTAQPKTSKEIDRQLHLDDQVLRFKIFNKENV